MMFDFTSEYMPDVFNKFHPWEKKIAWSPTQMDDGSWIWLKTYFERRALVMPVERFQRVRTLFDVLKRY